MEYTNPYLYGMGCISGKWKATILHHIHTYGSIRFNETRKTLPISEKVLSQQLKELERDGLVHRIQHQVMPLKSRIYSDTTRRRINPCTGYYLYLEY